jgi:hypothetical protein
MKTARSSLARSVRREHLFEGLCGLLRSLNFSERIRSSHHIFSKEGVEEIINLQPIGSKAKAYQVKQVRGIILKYRLGGETNE